VSRLYTYISDVICLPALAIKPGKIHAACIKSQPAHYLRSLRGVVDLKLSRHTALPMMHSQLPCYEFDCAFKSTKLLFFLSALSIEMLCLSLRQ